MRMPHGHDGFAHLLAKSHHPASGISAGMVGASWPGLVAVPGI